MCGYITCVCSQLQLVKELILNLLLKLNLKNIKRHGEDRSELHGGSCGKCTGEIFTDLIYKDFILQTPTEDDCQNLQPRINILETFGPLINQRILKTNLKLTPRSRLSVKYKT